MQEARWTPERSSVRPLTIRNSWAASTTGSPSLRVSGLPFPSVIRFIVLIWIEGGVTPVKCVKVTLIRLLGSPPPPVQPRHCSFSDWKKPACNVEGGAREWTAAQSAFIPLYKTLALLSRFSPGLSNIFLCLLPSFSSLLWLKHRIPTQWDKEKEDRTQRVSWEAAVRFDTWPRRKTTTWLVPVCNRTSLLVHNNSAQWEEIVYLPVLERGREIRAEKEEGI